MDLLSFASAMRLGLYQCGQVAQALQGRVAREDKAPDSVHQISTAVSLTDRLCQEILLLRAGRPELEIQSEELADCPAPIAALFARNRHRYVLVLGPVDGSGDYLEGKDTYAHMLGLLDQETGRMDCGMVYFPAQQQLYAGCAMGAFAAQGFWGPGAPSRPRRRHARSNMSNACCRLTLPRSLPRDSRSCRRPAVRPPLSCCASRGAGRWSCASSTATTARSTVC
ncbi:MAG: hypothetical protein HZY76_19650 [Anaerolineae bacterium]|nr:MAG: hypothetical protein HZY76_19650 [Anaerolineae bacterium]